MNKSCLAILCGGRSSRLGSDKGLYRPLGDESLVARALRLWGAHYLEVLIVVRDKTQALSYQNALTLPPNVRIVTDEDTRLGLASSALAGIITALCASSQSFVTTIPVDQLALHSLCLSELDLKAIATRKPQAFLRSDGSIWPFPAVWPKDAVSQLLSLAKEGELSVGKALIALGAELQSPTEWEEELAVNANTLEKLERYFGRALQDPQHRRLHYLRFSLTEACNMSCGYCLPEGFPEWYRHKARLSPTDIGTILKGFRLLGFRKVRFTGGEPTLHPGLLSAIRTARQLGYEQITMTTNGTRLGELSPWLKAGLNQINISLDTLNPTLFQQMTHSSEHHKVMTLIDECIKQRITLKINTVLMRSLNGGESRKLIDWAVSRPLTLRFIELMPTGLNHGFAADERILSTELLPILENLGLKAETTSSLMKLDGPAKVYGSEHLPGKIGLISPLSCNFCGDCNRLRVTARGRLKLCLFGDSDLPIDLSSADTVAQDVRRHTAAKALKHHLEDGNLGNVSTFRTIGG